MGTRDGMEKGQVTALIGLRWKGRELKRGKTMLLVLSLFGFDGVNYSD